MKKFLQYILPVLAWMGLIFRLSAIPAASLPAMPTENALFWAHKCTHFAEYLTLGFLSRRALVHYGLPRWLWVIALIAVFALSDEWHQSFVPGRTASLVDVTADIIYGWLGIMLYNRLRQSLKDL